MTETIKVISEALGDIIAKAHHYLLEHKKDEEDPYIITLTDGAKAVRKDTAWGIHVEIKEYTPTKNSKTWAQCDIFLRPNVMHSWFQGLGNMTGKLELQSMGLHLSFYPSDKGHKGVIVLTNRCAPNIFSAFGDTPTKALETGADRLITTPDGEKRKFVERILIMRVVRAEDGSTIRLK